MLAHAHSRLIIRIITFVIFMPYDKVLNLLKVYLDNHFFVEGQVGVAILLSGGYIYNRYSSAYIYTASFGYTFNKGLDRGVRYEDWKKDVKISQAALRVSYRFK